MGSTLYAACRLQSWLLLVPVGFMLFCCHHLSDRFPAMLDGTKEHRRTVIVGDVHGCSVELQDLLRKLQFKHNRDSLILVGDLVGKGPHPKEVVRIARELGALAVQGNHEYNLLQ